METTPKRIKSTTDDTSGSAAHRPNVGLHPDFVDWSNPRLREAPKPITPASAPARPLANDTGRLRTMPYKDYLRSSHWHGVRQAALARADNRCQLCNASQHLQVHHRTYERRGAEHDNDVVVLCRRCHERFHGIGTVRRVWYGVAAAVMMLAVLTLIAHGLH